MVSHTLNGKEVASLNMCLNEEPSLIGRSRIDVTASPP